MQEKKEITNMLHVKKDINFVLNALSHGMEEKNVKMKLIKILKNGKKIKLLKDVQNVKCGQKKT